MSDARIRSLRAEIRRWSFILRDSDRPALHGFAARELAAAQAELEALDGTPATVTTDDVASFEADRVAARERVLAGKVPPMIGTRINGVLLPPTAERETELVSTPESQVLAARRTNRASVSPAALPLGGFDGGGTGPMAYAGETGNLCDIGPSFQTRPTHLSGRSID